MNGVNNSSTALFSFRYSEFFDVYLYREIVRTFWVLKNRDFLRNYLANSFETMHACRCSITF